LAGCGNSVGMALAGRWLAQHFNRPGFAMFGDVWRVCGDGDMMEVSGEPFSPVTRCSAIFAGSRQQPDAIEGHIDLAFSDDVAARFPRLWMECGARRCQ
jgi:transketolase